MSTKESSLAEYKAWLKERWSPLVALVPDDESEGYCRNAFNRDLKDIFLCERRIKGLNKGLGVPIRTPAEYPIRLHEVNIRFCNAGVEYSALSDASDIITAETRLKDVLHQHIPEKDCSEDPSEDLPEYFERYCEAFFDALRFQVHETQDDPLICLFVMHVSSIGSWQQKLETLEENISPKLSSLLSGGIAQKHVIFVGERNAEIDNVLRQYDQEKSKKRFSLPSYVDLSQKTDGGFELKTFVEALASTCLVPFIEERIRELEVIIGSSRRGLKNQLKTFLFRKTPSSQSNMSSAFDGPEDSEQLISSQNSPQFQELDKSSVEAAMRRQSDLLMMVGDYNTAISTLKLLSTDLRSDKLYFHYASAQECLGVANIVGGISLATCIGHFRESFIRYAGLIDREKGYGNTLAILYSTRLSLVWARLLASMGRYSDASWIIMRAHFNEGSLRAGLLLEYSAYLQARQKPPKNRRYGFHLVLAGLRFGQSNEFTLASMMHKKAIKVLNGRGWDIMEEHVHEALGQEYREAGENSKALHHSASTLSCFNVPAHLQSTHMSHFIDLYAKVSEEMGVQSPIELDFPEFDTSHFRIISGGEHDYFDVASRDINARVWKEIESGFPRVQSAKTLSKDDKDMRIKSSYSGEDILISLPVYNPLKIDVELDNLELMCSTSGEPNSGSGLICSKECLHLYPGEKIAVHLKCRPLSTGVLKIEGLRWKMGGIPCEKIFRPSISKWSIEPENRIPRGGEIEFQILPPMPRLQVEFKSFPAEVNVGELIECDIQLANNGAITLHNITAMSSPNIILSEAYGEEMKEGTEYRKYRYNLELSVSETSTSKLTFRSEHPGHQTLYIVWKYEPFVQVGSQPARMLRLAKRVHVLPSLDLRAFLISSSETAKLLLEIHNTQAATIKLNDFILHSKSNFTKFQIDDALETGACQECSFGLELGEISEDAMYRSEQFLLLKNDSKYLASEECGSPMGVLHFKSMETDREAFVVSPLTREAEEHCILAQLCGPKSLNHNFGKGPLSINLELRIQSQLHETVDACWIIGQTPRKSRATANLVWKGEKCGIARDIKPSEKRFVILETLVHTPGVLQIDNIYINWNARAHAQTGSIKIKSSFITVYHVSD